MIGRSETSGLAERHQDRLRAGQVARMYRLVLGREPDATGMASGVRALRRNLPLARLISETLHSDEFTRGNRRLPTTPADIDRMFVAAFDREPAGLAVADPALPAEHYAARLLTAAEALAPSSLTRCLFPEGIDLNDAESYRLWLDEHHRPSTVRHEAGAAALSPGVAVSLILIGGAPYGEQTALTLASVRAQRSPGFELIAVGDEAFCSRVVAEAPFARSAVVPARDVAARLNAGLALSGGDMVLRLTPGMRLAPDAVLHSAEAVAGAARPAAALLVDYDRLDRRGRRHAPVFATGWDAGTALLRPDWGNAVMLRRKIARACGARPDHPGWEWEDLALRVIAPAGSDSGRVDAIPRLLWSVPSASRWAGWFKVTAARKRAQAWARLAEDHLAAAGSAARRVTTFRAPVRLVYPLPRCAPLVSIIIPTRDRVDLLRTCLDGIRCRTDYPAREILIVDNCSAEAQTAAYLADCARLPDVKILRHDSAFNWGAINNEAVRVASGAVLLLLNNDTEVIEPGWLTELVAQAMRPEIGVVGAKRLYPNGTVQHAGLTFGPGAQSYHRFRHVGGRAAGYRGALTMVREVSAVTGACLALRRTVFDEVGGIEERALSVTWSDSDLCLRVRARGYRVICTPFAVLRHHELATRGADTTPERAARAEGERQYMLSRWPMLSGEDPFYNPNVHLGERDTRIAGVPRLPCVGR